MCTVTFVPTTQNSFIFTSNRDERYDRTEVDFPSINELENEKVYFPKDCEAKGTWIASSSKRLACLLNGAFEKHVRTPPYRLSRGVILLDSFKYSSVPAFIVNYDLSDIEPFTMIILEYDVNGQLELHQLKWDGKIPDYTFLPTDEAHIWSSPTLYTPEVVKEKEVLFQGWMKDKEPTPELLKDFHKNGKTADPHNNVMLERPEVGTISITSIIKNDDSIQLVYDDLHADPKVLDLPNGL